MRSKQGTFRLAWVWSLARGLAFACGLLLVCAAIQGIEAGISTSEAPWTSGSFTNFDLKPDSDPCPRVSACLKNGNAKRWRGDFDGAIAEYTAAVRFAGWYKTGYYTKAIELKPRQGLAYGNRANAKREKSKTAVARDYFQKSVATGAMDCAEYVSTVAELRYLATQ
jgi:hypothetical protein